MRPLSRWARGLAVVSHLLLIAGMALRAGFSPALLLAAPLLLPLPGILRGRTYTCAWASMLLCFYAAGYLAAGYADPAQKWACFALASLAALDFTGLVLYVRLLARERPASQIETQKLAG